MGFVILGAAIAALLNALDRFALAALVPLLLNVLMIMVLTVILFGATAGPRESGLVSGHHRHPGRLFQLVLLVKAARRAGLSVSPAPINAIRGGLIRVCGHCWSGWCRA